jgi:transcriptional regulator with XRE-family HTH domain
MNAEEMGFKIRERRQLLKIKQSDLAEISRIGERTLRAIEKGVANPEINNLLKICNVLGLEIMIEVKQ